jgi:hypothetical protein
MASTRNAGSSRWGAVRYVLSHCDNRQGREWRLEDGGVGTQGYVADLQHVNYPYAWRPPVATKQIDRQINNTAVSKQFNYRDSESNEEDFGFEPHLATCALDCKNGGNLVLLFNKLCPNNADPET